MPYDFKKEEKEYYQAKSHAQILYLPPMRFIALDVKGGEGIREGAAELTAILTEIRSASRSGHEPLGPYDFVMPPLEVLWCNPKDRAKLPTGSRKSFNARIMLRLPSFVSDKDLERAKGSTEVSTVTLDEGQCVQMLHQGSLSRLGESVEKMQDYIASFGYRMDTTERPFHEIWLNDHFRTPTARLKTVVRLPISIAVPS